MKGKLLIDCLPDFARELEALLMMEQDSELARQTPLMQLDAAECGSSEDFCSILCTGLKPGRDWGRGDTSIVLKPDRGSVLLNVLECGTMSVQVFFRKDVREKIEKLGM